MSPRRRRVLIRAVGIVAVVAQVLVGLLMIVISPAALVAVITGAGALRLVGRDLEGASMRFGVSLLASGVGVVFGIASGAVGLVSVAVLSTGCFALAWSGVQQLAREQRAAFGIKHRDWTQRDARLHERREALRNGRPDGPSVSDGPAMPDGLQVPDGPGDGGAASDDRDPWWEDLS